LRSYAPAPREGEARFAPAVGANGRPREHGDRGALMSEGLDPIETGRKLHEHGEEANHHGEATQQHGQGAPPRGDAEHQPRAGRHSRIVQIAEAILLALVTITAAWAGFAAAKWATQSRIEIARSATLRGLATRADLSAISLRNFDSSTFEAWYIAWTMNSRPKEIVAERRFRPAFRVAFKAWMATDPLHNRHAPPGPTYMPQYKLPAQARANALDRAATAKLDSGSSAGGTSDDYVRITVLLAAVLFLVGIGSTFNVTGVRYALIGLGTGFLVVAVVLIVQQPGLPR
jgi:hypothetical protein